MELEEKKLNDLVEFIFQGIRNKHWLYWPPGPMVVQVFDKEACKKDIRKWIEKN